MNSLIDSIHTFFVPKDANNYKAKALHTDILTVYLLLAIITSFTFKQLGGSFSNILGFATDITVEKLYEFTNTERVKAKLPTLTYNEKLAEAAAQKAQDMFNRNYWSHYAPDGTAPWDYIIAANYNYEFAGENLAKNFLFSQGVVDAWMKSKTHRENILRQDYREVGFAVVNGLLNGEQTTLVVQMFGKPVDSSLAGKSLIKPRVMKTSQSVLAERTSKQTILGTWIPYNINLLFVGLFLLALMLDFYFVSRLNIMRVGGKHLAHIIFVGFILIGLLFITKGAIL